MTNDSNTIGYSTKTADYPVVRIPSGTAANTITLVTTGSAAASVILDLLIRSLDGANRNFEIIICTTGQQATAENAAVQVQVPANSGNNGVTPIFSLSNNVPFLFDFDLAGNRCITLESTMSIYIKNAALTAGDIYVRAKRRSF